MGTEMGPATDQTAAARGFARLLGELTGLIVHLQDERLTSYEAESRLAERERNWRKRKALLDAAAASAQKSFEEYLEVGQRAMRRVADPKSVSGSVVDDAQAVLSLMARDALVAVQMWSTYVELSAKKDE